MDARVEIPPTDGTIGYLFRQLVDDGRHLLGAEVNLYKEIARYRVAKAKSALVILAAGGLLAFGGLISALVGLVIGLAPWVGPVAAGLMVLVAAGATGWLLIRYGMTKLAALDKSSEEQAALKAGGAE